VRRAGTTLLDELAGEIGSRRSGVDASSRASFPARAS